MNFFFDRCVPPRLCDIVKAAEGNSPKSDVVEHLNESFAGDTVDIAWIREIGQRDPKPVVISGDGRILKRPDEANALKEQDLTFFCLDSGWVESPFWDAAWRFLKLWPEIVSVAAKCREPKIFRVSFGKSLKIEEYAVTKNLRLK